MFSYLPEDAIFDTLFLQLFYYLFQNYVLMCFLNHKQMFGLDFSPSRRF